MADVTIDRSNGEATTVTIPGTFPVVEREIGFECASGEWIERTYDGVPFAAVASTVDLPGDTTHLRVTARDGHVACLAVGDVLDGILAIEGSGTPRLVAPGIAGPRAIKRVQRIEALSLPPETDPERFERVPPDAES